MEKKIDRLDKYMIYKGLNDNKITIKTGITNGVIGKSRQEGRDLSSKTLEVILKYYTDLNPAWLLTGEGDMLKKEFSQPLELPSIEENALLKQLMNVITIQQETMKLSNETMLAQQRTIQQQIDDRGNMQDYLKSIQESLKTLSELQRVRNLKQTQISPSVQEEENAGCADVG